MKDTLTIEYEEFPEDDITVLSVSRGDECLWMFEGKEARRIYKLLLGDDMAIQLAREGRLI